MAGSRGMACKTKNRLLILLIMFSCKAYTATVRPDGGDTCWLAFKILKNQIPAKILEPAKNYLSALSEKYPLLTPVVNRLKDTEAVGALPIRPDIDFHQLQNVRAFIPEPAYIYGKPRYKDFFKTAFLDGEKVFLKIISLKRHLKELSNIRFLNEREARILFKGVTRTDDGTFYMVSRFQEGAMIRLYPRGESFYLDSDHKVTEKTYHQLRSLKAWFIREGIIPADLQFLISKTEDIYLIDLEYYFKVKDSWFLRYYTAHNFKLTQRVIRRDFLALPHEKIRFSGGE